MVVYGECPQCGKPTYYKDGKPKCYFCGNEDGIEVSYSEVKIE